ncbi:hypothetical protein CR155_11105 [Pollutimonas nitritireducens]|uniref:Uncharacterized protein n=2 Tax=Pollutimonas nitritireducens TaxID=2045209 RepID=A0A2N4UGB1_9BURK|nr:hypothetical protein CR155_11105 [Pollutimonas nitritireducens]
MVTMAPPPDMDEEFNDWYDTEHVPERTAVDGFETAQRYVCLAGFPRYMAAYDLTSPLVLAGQQYQNISGEKYSPWTKRILRKVRGLWRISGTQVYPGEAPVMQAPRLLLLHYGGLRETRVDELVSQLRATYDNHGQVWQLRLIRNEPSVNELSDYVAIVEGGEGLAAIRGPALEGEFGRHVGVVNEYARYWANRSDHALSKVVDER